MRLPADREFYVRLRVYVMKGNVLAPESEPVFLHGPSYGIDGRDALARAASQVMASWAVSGDKEYRPLVFPIAVTEIVPTRDELMAGIAAAEAAERARKVKWAQENMQRPVGFRCHVLLH